VKIFWQTYGNDIEKEIENDFKPYNKLANIYGDWIVGDETNLNGFRILIKIVS